MMTKYTMGSLLRVLVVAVLVTPAPNISVEVAVFRWGACAPSFSFQTLSGSTNMTSSPSTTFHPSMRGMWIGDRRTSSCPNNFISRPILSPCPYGRRTSLCLFSASMKRFRTLGWMFLVTFVLFLLNKGRGYYTGPAYVMLLAAGCVWFENWFARLGGKKRQVGYRLVVDDAGDRESDRDHPDETDRANQHSALGIRHWHHR